MGYGYWRKYVPVAKRRDQAAKQLKAAKKKGKALNPVVIEVRNIANTFWGKAWCDNLENYSDYENRLPRGRTYARNGSVIDLQISQGKVHAQVMGSSLYEITIKIQPMSPQKWKPLVKACTGKIDSLIDLLRGKFSEKVMSIIVDKETGLFPKPSEISMQCSCPDYAGVCKHIAAVFYGIGAYLDTKPEWLFTLRHVDHLELIASAGVGEGITTAKPGVDTLEESAISSLFGIDIAPQDAKQLPAPKKRTPSKLQKATPAEPDPGEADIELTISQAASLLKISAPRLTRLLDDKMIPFRLVGRQKRILFEEILKYRKNRSLS